MHKENNIKLMWKMSKLVRPLAGYMVLAVILGVVGYLCAIYIPYFAALLITHIAIQAPDFPIHVFFILLLIFALMRGILHYGEQACNHYIAFRLLALLRDKVFKALRKLAPAKLDRHDSGDLIYLITGDIEALEVFYAHTISPILIALVTSIILLFQFYRMHILFFLIALAGYAFCALFIPFIIMKQGKKDGETSKAIFGEMSSYTLENLRNMQDILQYQIADERKLGMLKRSLEVNKAQEKLKRHEGKNASLQTMAVMSFSLLMLGVATTLYMQGEVSITSLIMTTVLMLSSFGPVLALSSLSNHLLLTMASARRVLALLEEAPQVEDINGKEDAVFDTIKVENISFAYDKERILDKVSHTFEKGKITGILGKSGSGKSTLLKLLMRFYEAHDGAIQVGERALDSINTNDLRDMQSYVTQDTIMFHDTIFNNVHIANLEASVSEVERACKKANIHDFIMSLPKEYETSVAELGSSLSAGERQRIALARAFLHQAPCILLDEPTSSLDVLNEAMILKSLKEQKDTTILLVTHRQATLRIADEILHIENGRVS